MHTRSLILGLSATVALGISVAAPPSPMIGKTAPDFVLKGLDGRNMRLSEYRGQVVLINFWARWAGPSRDEMPALEQINGTYQRAGLVVLGVSIDEDLTRAREFAGSMRVSYPMLFDTDDKTGTKYSIEKLPTTYLIDRGGVIRYSNVGFKRGDEKIYLDQIRELLRE
jgi:peroxiredoxin